MQNNNSKLNTVLLVVVIILLSVGIWVLAGKGEREPRIESEPQIIVEEQPQEKDEEKPVVVQQKPTATTLSFKQNVLEGTTMMTMYGSFDGHGATTTTWFEYWYNGTGYNTQAKIATPPVVQANTSGDVFATINPGSLSPASYRLVTQNSAGITYGETKTFAIAMP